MGKPVFWFRFITSLASYTPTLPEGYCQLLICHNHKSWTVLRQIQMKIISRCFKSQGKHTAACLFWIVSFTVILRPFQSPVALAMSSPTFLGDCRNKNNKHHLFATYALIWIQVTCRFHLFQAFWHRAAHQSEQPCFLELGVSEPPLDYTESLSQTSIVAGGWSTQNRTHFLTLGYTNTVCEQDTYQTQRSNFGGQRGSGTNLSTCASHVHWGINRQEQKLLQ